MLGRPSASPGPTSVVGASESLATASARVSVGTASGTVTPSGILLMAPTKRLASRRLPSPAHRGRDASASSHLSTWILIYPFSHVICHALQARSKPRTHASRLHTSLPVPHPWGSKNMVILEILESTYSEHMHKTRHKRMSAPAHPPTPTPSPTSSFTRSTTHTFCRFNPPPPFAETQVRTNVQAHANACVV